MRAGDLCAHARRKEKSQSRPGPDLRIKTLGISGLGIEVRNRLLKPWHDLRRRTEILPREKAAHSVTEPHLDTAVPKPANLKIDLAIVDGLKFSREVHTTIFARTYFVTTRTALIRASALAVPTVCDCTFERSAAAPGRQRNDVIGDAAWARAGSFAS